MIGAFHSVLLAIHMPDFAAESVFAAFACCGYTAFYNSGEGFCEQLRLGDGVAERDRALGRRGIGGEVHAGRALAQPVPATDHPRAVVHIDLARAVGQQRVQVNAYLLLIYVENHDLVVR